CLLETAEARAAPIAAERAQWIHLVALPEGVTPGKRAIGPEHLVELHDEVVSVVRVTVSAKHGIGTRRVRGEIVKNLEERGIDAADRAVSLREGNLFGGLDVVVGGARAWH